MRDRQEAKYQVAALATHAPEAELIRGQQPLLGHPLVPPPHHGSKAVAPDHVVQQEVLNVDHDSQKARQSFELTRRGPMFQALVLALTPAQRYDNNGDLFAARPVRGVRCVAGPSFQVLIAVDPPYLALLRRACANSAIVSLSDNSLCARARALFH